MEVEYKEKRRRLLELCDGASGTRVRSLPTYAGLPPSTFPVTSTLGVPPDQVTMPLEDATTKQSNQDAPKHKLMKDKTTATVERKDVSVSLLSLSSNHVDISIRESSNDPVWRFTSLYEKLGGPSKRQPIVHKFHDTLEACDLFDLGYMGHDFTWWNGQSGRNSVEESLHHLCSSDEWLALFPHAMVEHLDEDVSDHLSLLLNTRPELHDGRQKRHCRRFEMM
ncbi:hypothetical protein Cgig2_019100 [Carnegiea gigantea]|uniref:Uncharacterized protein n=1 Tax=Carnegiea gigantea TaxID=171969 RepID=A0A9Q1KE68_9CARY|nr:hypothetical protein Cgig2_019100 [Carnegiea gigantea]